MSQILLVEDDLVLNQVLTGILETVMSYKVISTNNGVEGLRRAESEAIDLAVIDLFMPEMDGLELIRELRQRQPQLRILAMSGGGSVLSSSFLPHAQKLGADRVLAKPFKMKEFTEAVREILAPLPTEGETGQLATDQEAK